MKQSKQNQLIFFFPLIDIGGVEKNFFIISKYLVKKLTNFNHYIVTFKKTNHIKKNIDKEIKIIKSGLVSFTIPRRFKFILCMIQLFINCLKFQNSIIFSFQGNFYALFIAFILKRKIIVRSNVTPDAWGTNIFKRKIFNFLLSKSNLIIVNSSEFKKKFKKYFNLKTTKIYNPIFKKKDSEKKKYKVNDFFFKKKTINLINIGRLVKQKNQIELINALSKVKSPDKFRLMIIGKGPEKKKLLKILKEKKLDKFIKISSKQKNMNYFLKKSDIFILSSIHEGLPNVLLEAAINKKYIISSNCPTGPKEILGYYKYGELYKVNRTNQLVNILNKLNDNKKLLLKLKKKIDLKNIMFDYKYNLNLYYTNILKLSHKL